MNELSEFERQLADGIEAIVGPRRPVDSMAIARMAASRAPIRTSMRSRVSALIGRGPRALGRRHGDQDHVIWSRRNLTLLLAVVVTIALIGGVIGAGSGLLRPPAVVPPYLSPQPTSSPRLPTATSTPTRSAMWTPIGSMVETRGAESVTLLATGNVLVAGGTSKAGGHGFPRATAELYDPSTGRWAPTGSMHTARWEHAAVLLANGDVLVVGGFAAVGHSYPTLTSAELYDPSTGAWTETGTLTAARADAKATLLSDGRVLVTGGIGSVLDDGPLRSAEVYDPTTGMWTQAAPMSVARTQDAATRLLDGRVIVVGGGCCGKPATASAELYDPVDGTWTRTGSLAAARRWIDATLLADGKVLVFGGDNNGKQVTTAELYDPATGVWAATGSPRNGGATVRLQDGRVLVKGNAAGELYDPVSESWSTVGGPTHVYADYISTLLLDGRVLVIYDENAVLFDATGKP